MKQRVISSMVGLVILGGAILLYNTAVFNVIICIISVIAVTELLDATGCKSMRYLTVISILLTIVIPFSKMGYVRSLLPQILFLNVLLFFIVLIRFHTTMQVQQLAMAFLFSTFVPLFFSSVIFVRDIYGMAIGVLYLLLALGSAWLCDTCAYFTGILFGKHKLAPLISPKKTVEGAVGGIVFGTLFMLLLSLGYSVLTGAIGVPIKINYIMIALFTPILGVIGILGDLSASVIKRQFGVKDYGNIMPGHGGVMDRFDSALFTMPAVFVLVQHFSIAIIL